MGYRTNFSIYVLAPQEDREAILDDIQKTSGYTPEERDDDAGFAYIGDASWCNRDRDLKTVSLRHPEAIIEVQGEGDDRDDTWSARYRAGEKEEHEMEHILPPFRDILTEREKATRIPSPKETVDDLKTCRVLIERALSGRHIAFSSPCPSSTEAAVRNNVRRAFNLIDISLCLLRA